jgi:hypothetical protein
VDHAERAVPDLRMKDELLAAPQLPHADLKAAGRYAVNDCVGDNTAVDTGLTRRRP